MPLVQREQLSVYLATYDDVSAARANIVDDIRWRNTVREHTRLGDLTPDEHDFANLPRQVMTA